MKKVIFILCVFPLLFFGNFQTEEEIPSVNKKVIAYCTKKMKKKVDRGECWDLAAFALNYANAQWKLPYKFGKAVNYKTHRIFPGDIVQFERVKIAIPNGYQYKYAHHTAIVYKILGKNKYLIAHQNVAGVKRVRTDELDLNYLKRGKVQFYRPQGR